MSCTVILLYFTVQYTGLVTCSVSTRGLARQSLGFEQQSRSEAFTGIYLE
jgi:hypothetical protein